MNYVSLFELQMIRKSKSAMAYQIGNRMIKLTSDYYRLVIFHHERRTCRPFKRVLLLI